MPNKRDLHRFWLIVHWAYNTIMLHGQQIQFQPNVFIRQNPYSKVHGANMGPIWGRQDPGGPHVGPMNFAIWVQSI